MTGIETELRKLIKEIVIEVLNENPISEKAPELITIEETAKICGCNRSVIDALIFDFQTNDFPVIKLSTKTIRIDKQRLFVWLHNGGLN